MVPLGRYQFMSFREDLRPVIARKPGGRELIQRMDSGYRPSSTELLRYFPPGEQDALFKQAMTKEIQSYRRLGQSGDALLACLGENWLMGVTGVMVLRADCGLYLSRLFGSNRS